MSFLGKGRPMGPWRAMMMMSEAKMPNKSPCDLSDLCLRCDGFGCIMVEYPSFDGEDEYEVEPCPDCEGTGHRPVNQKEEKDA